MPTITFTFTPVQAARIRAAQERNGFSGTDAEHIAEFKRRHIGYEIRVVDRAEEEAERDARTNDPLEIT